MVLTDRQRRDLHVGIYEYLLSQGPAYEDAAIALSEADPSCVRESDNQATIDENQDSNISDDKSVTSVSSRFSTSSFSSKYSTGGLTVGSVSSRSKIAHLPVLERKWTAVPRLQKKILELEKIIRSNRGVGSNGSTNGKGSKGLVIPGAGINGANNSGVERRMLPRPPCNYELKGHAGVISCVALHPTFTVAVSGSEDGQIKLWDHESGEYIRTLKGHTNTIHSLAFTPTGSHLVSTSSDLSIKLWDFTTYACVRTLRGHDHTISSAKFLPSPALLYNTNQGPNAGGDNLNGLSGLGGTSGSGGGLNNTNTSGIDTTLTGSNILVSASRDKSVKFWDLETGYCQYTLNDHNDWVRCIAVRDYDGNVMATAGNDLSIFVYNVIQDGGKEFDSQKCMKIATLTGHDHVIESIAFVTSPTASATSSSPSSSSNGVTSPTSTSASLSSPISMNGRKASFSSSTESSKTSKQKHTEKINNYLASGSRDRTVKLWNIQTQSCIATFASHENWVRSVVLHPSGKYIISAGDDRTIRIMDIQSNRCLRKIANAHPHFVTCLAIHYSLPIMVSGGVDQMVRCWQLE